MTKYVSIIIKNKIKIFICGELMTIVFLGVGVTIQAVAIYVAFFTQFPGHLYIATILMVLALTSLMAIRSLIAPACLLAGVIVGLALSHNQSDVKLLINMGEVMKLAIQPDWEINQAWQFVNGRAPE
ncbi:hypothetical protein [Photobacterium halotolerans]|uniref:Uncharacterized protein n=1 Tax=Photobacterium halotolerans TaxID=265726 RepID=A0A7X4WCF7_9GAMM|nr:hypothetical protein [Photobacterium halotolerans]NAW66098.1 hypothetical protein [Photobacterium halotolerans]